MPLPSKHLVEATGSEKLTNRQYLAPLGQKKSSGNSEAGKSLVFRLIFSFFPYASHSGS